MQNSVDSVSLYKSEIENLHMLSEFLERHPQTGNTLKPWGAAGGSY